MKPESQDNHQLHAGQDADFVRLSFILACEYENVYIIQSANGNYVKYRPDRESHTLLECGSGEDFYEALGAFCAACTEQEDRDEIMYLLGSKHLAEAMEQARPFTISTRFLVGGEPLYYNIKVFPCASQEMIVLGVRNADTQMRRELRAMAERQIYQSIVDALSNRYEVIYYVDTVTGAYSEYSSSEKYARLEVGKTGTDFFGDTQRNLKLDIEPEDYPMMQEAMKRENLLGSIRKHGSATLSYRLLLDGSPQYVTLYATHPPHDQTHLIIAVANVDADVRREQEYREALGSAIRLANQDALTGVKNKHAYTQREQALDQLISSKNPPEFAVVVCDVNGLKKVNDTKGHVAGDAYICHASKMLCTIFAHSPVYRIGGDEFVMILEGSDYQNRETLMQTLHQTVRENRAQEHVTVASGISVFEPADDVCVQDVFERADREMYAQKRKSGCHAETEHT